MQSDIMFEVYRESGYDRRFRVCYFTDLHEGNRDAELERCLAGETLLAGYIARDARAEARALITSALRRLNDGELIPSAELELQLRPHMV
jgi:hypothetical protein